MNTEKFTGKVFVITGAGSGMGAAMAKEFAAREAKVALFDINDEGTKQIVDTICKNGGVAKAYHVDVTNKAEIENAAADVENEFGSITSWINSAGVSRMVPFLDCSEELWDLTINVNLNISVLSGCYCKNVIKWRWHNFKYVILIREKSKFLADNLLCKQVWCAGLNRINCKRICR